MSARNDEVLLPIDPVIEISDEDRDSDTDTENSVKQKLSETKSEQIALSENQSLEGFDADGSETKCGFWCCGGAFLQRFANQSMFIIIYGVVGSVLSMTYAYFNGTITTMEKRFHMSSRAVGITQVGNDITQMLTSLFFIHYAGKQHRPRWMGVGISTLVMFCFLTTIPHWLYGPGEDALKLTTEHGGMRNESTTIALTAIEDAKKLCRLNTTIDDCKTEHATNEGHPQLILFLAHSISGVGYSLYYSLGYSYMDDNVEKSKTASMYSFSYSLNMFGPSIGYTLAAFCLRQYISPSLHPVIDNRDPRWIGAWWLGWLIFGSMLTVFGVLLSMFPKKLPIARKRKLPAIEWKDSKTLKLQTEKESSKELVEVKKHGNEQGNDSRRETIDGLFPSFKRLIRNKIFMCNSFSSIFYFFGYMPYWIFTPKYLEIQFRQSAAESNVYTGTVALVFTAVGVLVSGVVVSRKKPRARYMAGWNATMGFLTVLGLLSYSLIGCPGNEDGIIIERPSSNALGQSVNCAAACHCDYVPYAPVCGANNFTYISACHAGCKSQKINSKGEKIYFDCECMSQPSYENKTKENTFLNPKASLMDNTNTAYARPGACPVDCFKNFLVFLTVMCSLKFIGATTRASYFLIQVRSVSKQDKAFALGFGMVLMSLLTFIPSPIFFGWLLDRMCLVWGKTCTEKGNCWLYDSKALRFTLNCTSASFVFLGALCDCTVCYLVKNLKIFDDDHKEATDEKIASNRELSKLNSNT